MQRVRDRSQPWTRRLNAISHALLGLVLCTLFATAMIWTMFPESASWASTTAVLFILCIIAPSLITVDVMVKFAEAFDHSELVGTPLKMLLALAMSARLSEVKRASVVLKQKLLPDGFRDLQPSKLMKPLFKSEYRALGVFYLGAGGLGGMCLLTVLGTGQGALTQIFRTWAVFWVLMVALSMTLPFTLAWVALKVCCRDWSDSVQDHGAVVAVDRGQLGFNRRCHRVAEWSAVVIAASVHGWKGIGAGAGFPVHPC